MAEGLNKVMLLGNVGADPELRFTQGGLAVLNIRLATSESYLDKDKVRRERTEWSTVVMFGKRGESLSKLVGKGSSIFVEGSLRTSSYDDKDGSKRYKTEVHANNIILCGGRGRGGGAGGEGAPQDEGRQHAKGGGEGGGSAGGGERGGWAPPAGGHQQAAPAHAPTGGYPDDFTGGYDSGDDIPF